MFRSLCRLSFVATMSFLAACGGGAGIAPVTSGAPVVGKDAPNAAPANQSISSIFGSAGSGAITVDQIDTATNHLNALLTAADENRVVIGRPTDASVALSGLIGVGDPELMTIGRLALSANFTTDQLTGSTSDFSTFSGTTGTTTVKIEDLSGALTISGGSISGSGLVADIDGVLTGSQTVSYDGQLRGNFLDVDGEVHAIGIFDGTSSSDGQALESLNNGTFLVSE